jgi:hypothetical protein
MATRLSWLSKYSLFFSLPFPHHSPQHRFVSADTHNLDQTDFFSDLELFTSVMEGVSVAREEPRCRQSQAGFDCAVELLARQPPPPDHASPFLAPASTSPASTWPGPHVVRRTMLHSFHVTRRTPFGGPSTWLASTHAQSASTHEHLSQHDTSSDGLITSIIGPASRGPAHHMARRLEGHQLGQHLPTMACHSDSHHQHLLGPASRGLALNFFLDLDSTFISHLLPHHATSSQY